MKKLILILFAIVLLFGCEEKHKIEIIPDYDLEYKPISMVETIASSEELKLVPFSTIIKEVHQKENSNEAVLYPIYLRYFINENGKIDKVKILRNNLDVITRKSRQSKYEEKIYNYPEKIVQKALHKLEKLVFTPAKSQGKNIKMRADVKLIFIATPNGEVSVDETKMKRENAKSDFDNPLQGIFFVAVEEMPQPIGGIKAIQKNIIYPELAKRAGVQGRVYVKAYVDSTGVVVKTELIRGIGGGCDEAAINAVKKVKFIPGKQRGKRMNVQVTVPILFKLDESTSEINKPKAKDELILKYTKDENQNGLARVGGIIISQSGDPIVAANILLEGTKRGCSSNHMGEFFLSKIEPGEYSILVTSNTYGKHSLGKLKVSPNKTIVVELKISKTS